MRDAKSCALPMLCPIMPPERATTSFRANPSRKRNGRWNLAPWRCSVHLLIGMPSLELGLWFDDRYELARPLGRGGMAEVYLAHDVVEARSVAVKILLPTVRASRDIRRRLQHEVEVSSRLDHPHVSRVFGGGTAPGDIPYLVGEALEGETLRRLLLRERSVPPDRLLGLLIQAALGLEAAHRQDVVHCDIKPGNLFLCGPVGEASVLKVFDFGLAQSMGVDLELQPESIAGTMEYMAPEQVVGDPVDARADIYGLGVVLFRALTGELPFDATPTTRLLGHHLMSPVPPPSWLVDDLDPRLETVVMSSVRKHPANRPHLYGLSAADRAGFILTHRNGGHKIYSFRKGDDPLRELPRLGQFLDVGQGEGILKIKGTVLSPPQRCQMGAAPQLLTHIMPQGTDVRPF